MISKHLETKLTGYRKFCLEKRESKYWLEVSKFSFSRKDWRWASSGSSPVRSWNRSFTFGPFFSSSNSVDRSSAVSWVAVSTAPDFHLFFRSPTCNSIRFLNLCCCPSLFVSGYSAQFEFKETFSAPNLFSLWVTEHCQICTVGVHNCMYTDTIIGLSVIVFRWRYHNAVDLTDVIQSYWAQSAVTPPSLHQLKTTLATGWV